MLTISENEPLAKYTSWRIGGPARFFAEALTPDELREALQWASDRDMSVFLLGGGTNTLIRDAGYDGLVLRYRAQEVRAEENGDDVRVWIGAGAPMAGTVRKLARQGYAGLEWAEGLPGTIGGAVYGNAGCYGSDVASTLQRAWLLVDGAVEEWGPAKLGFGYRTSALKSGARSQEPGARSQEPSIKHQASSITRPIVVAAEFALHRGDPATLAAQMAATSAARRSKTPSGQSCGSVFKNPAGDSSGRLIEAAGLKGTRIGGAQIAPKHGNYIVNVGGATSDDVLRLVELARERVVGEFGIELELEVQVI